ncbi:MAG: ABC transporter ATP-binding protein [Rhodothermales bacterium]|nr:ABC transporter ATP-binding protein [Rhodothermales bacterium]
MPAIHLTSLTKRFGAVTAVDGVSLAVEEGELFGLIGPDGAGKTTLIRMLVTLLKPDAGEARVDGLDVVADYRALRLRLGYMPGRFSLYPDLTVEENLAFFASVFGTTIAENYALVADIYRQIEPFKHRRAGQLSGGMKQKLALSCALIHKPRVLFLDEPTTGVDAVSRQEFWEMLRRLKRSGITIVVSTPYMDEAGLCDRVALMQGGHVLGIDAPAALSSRFTRRLFAIRAPERFRLMQTLRAYPHAYSVYAFGESLHYTDTRPDARPADLLAYLADHGVGEAHVAPIAAGIEDVFMALMDEHREVT